MNSLAAFPIRCRKLADLLKSGDWRRYFRQLVSWALVDRTPVLQLAAQERRPVFAKCIPSRSKPRARSQLARERIFVRRHRAIIERQSARLDLFGTAAQFSEESSDVCCALLGRRTRSRPSPNHLTKNVTPFSRSRPARILSSPSLRNNCFAPGKRRSLMRPRAHWHRARRTSQSKTKGLRVEDSHGTSVVGMAAAA